MAGGNGHWKYREVGWQRNRHFLLKCINSFINCLSGFFFHSDVREMRNLLSKLRDTMPLPLKNQGAIIFHWRTCQHWGQIPTTHTHPPPIATAAQQSGWAGKYFGKKLIMIIILMRICFHWDHWKPVIVRISKKCWTDKMAAVSKKRLERPLLVDWNYQLPLSWAEVWVTNTKRDTGNDTAVIYIIYIL